MIKYKITLFLLVLMASAGGICQINISTNCKSDILQIQEMTQKEVSIDVISKYPVNKINGAYYLNLLFKVSPSFSEDNMESVGALIGGKSGSILSVKWPIHQIDLLWSIQGVDVVQLAQKINPTLTKARYDTRVDSVHAGIGLSSPFTGKNVLIGITDWGFDYSSPMFYDTLLQTTRILSAWDQFKTSGPHPSGFGYGTEYNNATDLIAAGADTANIYSYATHGTHVAGIAGGSGAGTEYRGMAFEAEYLMATFLVDEGAVLDAWQWMYDKSQEENKRLVINMSWGLYHTGALDGTSLLSQALDNYSEQGVVFATSAGNNGDVNFHLKYDYATDTLKTRVNFYNGAAANLWGQSIHAWGEPGQPFEVKLNILNTSSQLLSSTQWYGTAYTNTYIDTFLIVGSDSVFYNLSMDDAYPSNNRPQMRLRIKKQPATYRVVMESTSNTGTVHYWNVTELSSDVGNWGMSFSSLGAGYTVGDAEYSIGAPACTETAITVAAHASEYLAISGTVVGGSRAGFSSIGPLMTGEIKPDISAPGSSVASSISSYTDNSFTTLTTVDFNGRTYPFSKFSGTSMSSPAVAGIAALMLEANPNLSPMQVKQIIMQTARLDSKTGAIGPEGDTEWGAGKINAYRAIKKAISTVGVLEVQAPLSWTVYPNPTTGLLNVKGLGEDVNSIQIINLNGQLINSFSRTTSVNLQGLSSGFYIIRAITATSSEQQVFIME